MTNQKIYNNQGAAINQLNSLVRMKTKQSRLLPVSGMAPAQWSAADKLAAII
jgi:hypothetical protein